jgi:diguanylate cyclase (GGDEF)-like protein/PAS domain S-box-containing protein
MRAYWKRLGVQGKLHILIQGSLILFFLISQQWVVNRFASQGIEEAKARALDTADGLINGLNLLMVTGKISDPANRLLLLRKMASSKGIKELRIIRAKQVQDQFGPGLPQEQAVDDLDRQAIASKQVVVQKSHDGSHLLRVVVPYIVSTNFRGTNCLACHHVQPGSVNGAASIVMDMSEEFAKTRDFKQWLWTVELAVQLALSLIIAFAVRLIVTRHIENPAKKLQSTMLTIRDKGDLSLRAEIEGKHSDIDEMAETFNMFVQNLEEATKGLALFAKVVENSEEAIIISDGRNNILSVNKAFTRITGYTPEETVGKNPKLLSSGRHPPEFYQTMWQSIAQNGHWQGEIWNRRKSGEIYPEWLSISTVKNSHGEIVNHVAIFMDITKRKMAEERINHLANYDPLTGLANRNLLQDRLSHACRHSSILAVMFLDLDHFKNVNDSLGHAIGDRLLKSVSERLLDCVRKEDTVARQGGDEFIIILADVARQENVTVIANKILHALSLPFYFDGHEIFVSGSIGAAFYPRDGSDEETLMKNADSALYRAKEEGRSCYQFYTPEMNMHAAKRLALENGLRRALEQNEFVLHYQPQADLATGAITGVEALVRWQHPEDGLVSPAQFIPIMEESGMIVPLGKWILRTACSQAKSWLDQGHDLNVAVNLSARQFKGQDFARVAKEALQHIELSGKHLELELTESILIENSEPIYAVLKELKELGIQLSIDDFGTGYSSLSYLKLFPIDKIKIDQSFVRDLSIDQEDTAIVEAIIAMAHSLKLTVAAEGVETPEQLAFLASRNCNEIQGYYFSKPLPANEVTALLQAGVRLALPE